jgi:catechol 2,3-dioxygenase-like lactoylglutathione lyase family enzyme
MTESRLVTNLTPELACMDIEVSVGFYTQVLDFKVQYQRPEDGFAMLEREGSRIMLDEMRADAKPQSHRLWFAGPLEYPLGRGINLQIIVSKVDDLYAKAKNGGARRFLPMEEKWYRVDDMFVGNRQFMVQDPDGYLLRFFQDLGEKKIAPDAVSGRTPRD